MGNMDMALQRIFNKSTLPRQILAMGMDVLCAWLALALGAGGA